MGLKLYCWLGLIYDFIDRHVTLCFMGYICIGEVEYGCLIDAGSVAYLTRLA